MNATAFNEGYAEGLEKVALLSGAKALGTWAGNGLLGLGRGGTGWVGKKVARGRELLNTSGIGKTVNNAGATVTDKVKQSKLGKIYTDAEATSKVTRPGSVESTYRKEYLHPETVTSSPLHAALKSVTGKAPENTPAFIPKPKPAAGNPPLKMSTLERGTRGVVGWARKYPVHAVGATALVGGAGYAMAPRQQEPQGYFAR